jgi:hypothetical protein
MWHNSSLPCALSWLRPVWFNPFCLDGSCALYGVSYVVGDVGLFMLCTQDDAKKTNLKLPLALPDCLVNNRRAA